MNKFITVVAISQDPHERRLVDAHRQHVKLIAQAVGPRGTRPAGSTVVSVLCPGGGSSAATTAVAIASDVDRPVFRVDLSAVASQYIGETEKNLDAVFASAQEAGAVLLIDESDTLFGKRTSVKDSHDRYANLDTSVLLQRIERYDGVVILSTNSRQSVDDTFRRHWRFVLE
jgi:SpoVK/Ycf46/Vps4 family AAA+-type ATPase